MASFVPPPDAVRLVNAAHTLTVWMSPGGCPLHVSVAPSLLRRGGAAVAGEVLRLCEPTR